MTVSYSNLLHKKSRDSALGMLPSGTVTVLDCKASPWNRQVTQRTDIVNCGQPHPVAH